MLSKKIIFITICIIFTLLSCSNEDEDFNKAKQENKVTVYNQFLQKYPNSNHKTEVDLMIENLEWENAKNWNSIQIYKNFISNFPNSDYNEEAKNKVRALEFQLLQKSQLKEMAFVEGGQYLMGSNKPVKYHFSNREKPAHNVSVGNFYISKYEVTEKLWNETMQKKTKNKQYLKMPKTHIDWFEAVEFCNKLSIKHGLETCYTIHKDQVDTNNKANYTKKKWLVECDFNKNGYRLPTEAEWEFAAKGGKKTKNYMYSGSNNAKHVAWCNHNFKEKFISNYNSGLMTYSACLEDVGKKRPNELGIYDMSGNALEWCWDWYGPYENKSSQNPKGPSQGSERVQRGGCYEYDEKGCRVTSRYISSASGSAIYSGFRFVRNYDKHDSIDTAKITSEDDFKDITFLYFFTDWCGSCKKQKPVINEIENKYHMIDFKFINSDRNPQLSKKHKIKAIPTMILEIDNYEVDRIVGYYEYNSVEKFIDRCLKNN